MDSLFYNYQMDHNNECFFLPLAAPSSPAVCLTVLPMLLGWDPSTDAGRNARTMEHRAYSKCIPIIQSTGLNNFVLMHCEASVLNNPQNFSLRCGRADEGSHTRLRCVVLFQGRFFSHRLLGFAFSLLLVTVCFYALAFHYPSLLERGREQNSFKKAVYGMEGESAGTDLSSGAEILLQPPTQTQGSKATERHS